MYCEKCGYPAQEGVKFCENCGAPIGAVQAESEMQQPVAPVEQSPVMEQSQQPQEPVMQQWQPQQTQYVPYAEQAPEQGKTNTGLLVWSIIALVVSVCTCCYCLGIASLVLSIIALIFVCQAPKQATLAERKSKEKTAKIMLIIATVCLGLSVLVLIIASASGMYSEMIEQIVYELDLY